VPSLIALAPDLFFASRIQNVAERLGTSAAIARDVAELERLVADVRPDLVLIDLGARGLDPSEAIRTAKARGARRVVAFGPHKDLAARSAALAAGADRWLTNQRLPESLRDLLKD
jgi:CheY-like chemotaxis protein